MTNAKDVADAVAMELNAHSFSLAFTATREYQVYTDLKMLATILVTVIPLSSNIAQSTRGEISRKIEIGIAIQKKISADSNAAIDPLLALADEVAAYMTRLELSTSPVAKWIAPTKQDPLFIAEHLKEMRTFTSLITLTYHVVE